MEKLFAPRKRRADDGGKLCPLRNDEIDPEKLRKLGEEDGGVPRDGKVARQHDIADACAARRKNGHHTDRFVHHIEEAEGKILLGCHIAHLAEV